MATEQSPAAARVASSPSGSQRAANASHRFRRSLLSALQARRIKLWLLLAGKGLLRFKIEVEGLEHVPPGEPLIVAAAPHRNWIDPFLLLAVLPPLPRLYFLGSNEAPVNRWWKRLVLEIAGGFAPVSMRGGLNREGLETSLAILRAGNRLGIFPEGWVPGPADEVAPLKRGVAFLSEHTGLRVLPVGIAGAAELWRGKTLRVRIGPPLDTLGPNASRVEEQDYVDRLRDAIQAVLPPQPPEPRDGKKPWQWLTRFI